MKIPWKKLFIRKDCDAPTFSAAIHVAYDILWSFAGTKKEYLFALCKNKNIYYYIHDVNEFDAARAIYKRKYFKPAQIILAYKKGLKLINRTKLLTKKWSKILLHDSSQLNVIKAFRDFEKDYWIINYDYSILPWWALESWQHDFTILMRKAIIKNHLEDKQDIIFSSLLRPWKKTAIEEIQQKYKQGVSANKLANDYQFLRNWTVVWSGLITPEWVEGVCKKNAGQKHQPVYSVSDIIKLLHPDKEEKKYLIVAPYITFFKDWRDDLRRIFAFKWHFLFEVMASSANVELDDLGYLTLEELAKMASTGQVNIDLIKLRKEHGCVLTSKLDKLKIVALDNGKFLKYLKIMEEVDKRDEKATITGVVAQSGVARGRVAVVRHYKDIFKITGEHVMVANTTHPNYLAGMKKAVAFVTDEGGIASHAAIVARELKKPCIVGTKVATKMLKEGDMVEVDATRGIVRKI